MHSANPSYLLSKICLLTQDFYCSFVGERYLLYLLTTAFMIYPNGPGILFRPPLFLSYLPEIKTETKNYHVVQCPWGSEYTKIQVKTKRIFHRPHLSPSFYHALMDCHWDRDICYKSASICTLGSLVPFQFSSFLISLHSPYSSLFLFYFLRVVQLAIIAATQTWKRFNVCRKLENTVCSTVVLWLTYDMACYSAEMGQQ